MDEQEEFEFRLRLEREREQPSSPKNSLKSLNEAYIRGLQNLAAGGLRGAGSIGATLLTPIDYALGNTKSIGNPERRKAMDDALQTLGADTESMSFGAGKFAGEVAGTSGMPVARGGKYIADVLKNTLSGGAAAGLINPEDAASGAGVGGALTAVGRPVGAGARWAKENFLGPAWNLMRKGGEENIVRNYLTRMIGEDNVPATVQAARQGKGFTQGYEPKTVETMVKYVKNPVTGKDELVFMPEASPLSKITQIEASQPGGASAQFQRVMDAQDIALQKAEKARDISTTPLRETATRSANMAGGVNAVPIEAKLSKMMDDPNNYGSGGVRGVLADIAGDLEVIVRKGRGGYVDAEAIYAFRKDLNKRIGEIAKAKNVTFDKGIQAKLEADLRQTIDQEMNNAIAMSGLPASRSGTTVWDRYLRDFAKESENIRLDKARKELSEKPPQPTRITGGRDVAGEATPQAANMLTRPIMMTNWTLRLFGKAKEPMVDDLLVKVLTNPSKYEELMRGVNNKTRAQVRIAMDLMHNSAVAATAD